MGSFLFQRSLFVSLIACLFHQPIVSARGETDLIQTTCKNTKYYHLCLSSLRSDPTSSKAADTRGLAAILVGIGMANATATSSYLSSQLLATANGTLMKRVIAECANKYSYASGALQASLQDLAADSYDSVYIHLMAAADYPNACRYAFKRYPGIAYPPELALREEGLKHICVVISEIVDLLN